MGSLVVDSADKSPASLSHEMSTNLDASRLGAVVAQACFSATRMTKVVEDNHSSKVAEALLTKQHLEKASAEVIDLAMDEIQGAHTPVDMWQVEKRISTHISHERAKAYSVLVEQYCSEPEPPKGKDGSGEGPGQIAETEEEFHRSMTDLISTILH